MRSLSILAQMMRMKQLNIETVLIVKTVGVTIRLVYLTIICLHIILITYLSQLLIRFAKRKRRCHKVRKHVREHGEGYSSGKFTVAQPDLDLVRPKEEATTINTSPSSDCCAVCGFSQES